MCYKINIHNNFLGKTYKIKHVSLRRDVKNMKFAPKVCHTEQIKSLDVKFNMHFRLHNCIYLCNNFYLEIDCSTKNTTVLSYELKVNHLFFCTFPISVVQKLGFLFLHLHYTLQNLRKGNTLLAKP